MHSDITAVAYIHSGTATYDIWRKSARALVDIPGELGFGIQDTTAHVHTTGGQFRTADFLAFHGRENIT